MLAALCHGHGRLHAQSKWGDAGAQSLKRPWWRPLGTGTLRDMSVFNEVGPGRRLATAPGAQRLLERGAWATFFALSAAIGVVAYLTGATLPFFDERDYVEIARNVVAGVGYSRGDGPTAYRPPLWPLTLAAADALGATTRVLSLIPVACLVGSALVARRLGLALGGAVAGWIAGFGVLLYPLNVYTALTLYPQMLATVTLLGLVWCASLLRDRSAVPTWVALFAGLLAAALALAVPTMAPTGAVVLIWMTWRHKSARHRFVAVALIASLLPICIWAGRNYVAMDALVPMSTTTGVNLLRGNSEDVGPDTGVSVDISRYEAEVQGQDLGEVAADRYFRDSALEWVQAHPGQAATLYAGKLVNYFSPYNEPETASQRSGLAQVVAYTTYAALMAAAAGRLWLVRQAVPLVRPEGLMWLLYLVNAPVMAIVFTRTRFRQPLDALMIIEAAVLVGFLVSAALAKHTRGLHRSRTTRRGAAQDLSGPDV